MYPLAVTTSGKRVEGLEARARAAARAWGLPYVPRKKKAPLGPMLEQVAEAFLVFGGDGVTLWDREGSTGFTEGMAHLRLQRFRAGMKDDVLLRVAELRPGDTVLDCTLGLAQDALVMALAVGPSGKVVGVERSPALYALVSEGLKASPREPDACAVEALHADSSEYLKAQATGAFDVVLFDPMFEKPKKSQPSFELLRRHAEHAPLTPETLEEARRVARRWVVVKGAKYSEDLRKLGLQPEPASRSSTVAWGRIPGITDLSSQT